MTAAPRQFSRAFKLEVVKLVKKPGLLVAQAAPHLELQQTVLRSWIWALAVAPQRAFTGMGVMAPDVAQRACLRIAVAKPKMARDTLKKAAACCAQASR